MRRLGLQARLTLWTAALLLVAGTAVLAVLYVAVEARLDDEVAGRSPEDRIALLRDRADGSGSVTLPDGRTVDATELAEQVERDRERIKEAALHTLLWQGVVVVLVVTAVASAAGWVVAGRGLLPLRRVTRVAERIADASGPDRDLHHRIGDPGQDDDLGRLARAFDDMLETLDEAFDAQRRFTAHAAHELRTPLTLERAVIELAASRADAPRATTELARELLDLNRAHAALLDRLLLLADSTSPVQEVETVDLALLVRDVVDALRHSRDDTLALELDLDPARVRADPVLLVQLVRNLLENAHEHNRPDGWVRVTTTTEHDRALLTVSSSGPVVDDDVDELVLPFRRGRDVRRSTTPGRGAGLGLAIVAAVARAHAGAVDLSPRPTGGLDVRVTLPSAPE